jgi:colanic acid/amylovoran biosynthesis glycosyltransferase
MKIRIAIVVNSFPVLSETFIFNKVKGLVKEGFDVTVITHHTKNDLSAYQDQWNDVRKIKTLNAFTRRDLFNFRLYIKITSKLGASLKFLQATKGLRNWKARVRTYLQWLTLSDGYDIIHFEYSGLAVSYLALISIGAKGKFIVSCRGAAEQIRPLFDKKRATDLKTLFEKVDRVHCVSGDMLNTCVTYYQLDRRKAFVNRPAIQTERFQRSVSKKVQVDKPILICSTGRLHWKKGFEFALLAMHELKVQGISFRYEIIGEGIELEKLMFMANDLGIADEVHFVGRLSSANVKTRLESCDIFLLPSLSEGISNAVLEAMAMQVPVVSTVAGGMDELITDMENGLLTNTYDVQELANRIKLLIENDALREKMGQNGHRTILENFRIERQLDIFLREYNNMLNV